MSDTLAQTPAKAFAPPVKTPAYARSERAAKYAALAQVGYDRAVDRMCRALDHCRKVQRYTHTVQLSGRTFVVHKDGNIEEVL